MNNDRNNILLSIMIVLGSRFICLKPNTGLKPELAKVSKVKGINKLEVQT